jgi:hypothetical protein
MEGMAMRKRMFGAFLGLLMPLIGLAAGEGPPWPDKGPRILFNTNNVDNVTEVIPKTFYLDYWHSPTTTVVYSHWRQGEKGHLLGSKSTHGEEYLFLAKGRLAFVFDEYREHVVVDEGQFAHWPNIAHWGTCMTKECTFYALFVPTRDDYGPEGTKMTNKSNVWISGNQGK